MAKTDFGMAPDADDTCLVQEDLNPLPRSVRRRTPYELLDGEWSFALDLEDQGLAGGWYLGREYTQMAQFPGAIEAHLASAKETQALAQGWQDKVVAWYEREFQLSGEWCMAPECLTQLTFGACGYETRERRIAGDVYTQATSIEEEDNGIIEPHTGELLVPAGLLDSNA